MKESTSMSADACAQRILETIPRVMRSLGSSMHQRHTTELSMPQFRAMMIVKHHAGASLSLVSEHLGSSLSASSKLIDGLVERGYLSREVPPDDRRRVTLMLTTQGQAMLDVLWQEKLMLLAERLSVLSEEERERIIQAMSLLAGIFSVSSPTR